MEQIGAQIGCKVRWNNWVKQFGGKISGQLVDKIVETKKNVGKIWLEKLGVLIGLRNWVREAYSVQCKVYSGVVLLSLLREP